MITIEFNLNTLLEPDCLAGSFDGIITEIKGDILSNYGEEAEQTRVGIIDAYLFNHTLAINRKRHPFDMLDSVSIDIAEFILFYNKSCDLKKEYWSVPDLPPFNQNALILHNLKIVKDFRGLNIGAAAITRTMETFARGVHITMFQATPLQITQRNSESSIKKLNKEEPWMDYRLTSYKKVMAQKRLNRYYEMLGFTPCKSKRLKNYFYALSNSYFYYNHPHDLLNLDLDKLDERHYRFIKKFPEGMPR